MVQREPDAEGAEPLHARRVRCGSTSSRSSASSSWIDAGGDVTFVVATQVLRVIVMLLVAPVLARLARRRTT